MVNQRAEVNVFEFWNGRLHTVRRSFREHANFCGACFESRGQDRVTSTHCGDLFVRYGQSPQLAIQIAHQSQRLADFQNAPTPHNANLRAKFAHVIHNVRRKNDDGFLTNFGQNVLEASPLCRIKPRCGFIHDEQRRVSQQRLCDAVTLFHPAGKLINAFVARVPQIGFDQQIFDDLLLVVAVDAFERRQVFEHREGRDSRIRAKLLRQITKRAAQRGFVLQNVYAVECDGAAVGLLQRRNRSHQRRFACAIGAEQAEHSFGHVQMNVL